MANVKQLYIAPQEVGKEWDALLKQKELRDELLLADAAYFGVDVATNLRRNARRKLRSLLALKDSMKGVPALIVGAGPSLQKNLAGFREKALVLAAGTAFEALEVRPHLAVAIDPRVPLQRTKHFDVPLCLQGRVHPESLRGVTGELLYIPDSHFAFDAYLMGHEGPFEGGWTVGTTAVAIAVLLGCDPIVLVGMDSCYRDGHKYAHKEGEAGALVTAEDREGKEVFTQRDWILAVAWLREFAARHPDRSFFNATAEGMRIGAPFREIRLEELALPKRSFKEPWSTAPLARYDDREWRLSLKTEQAVARELLLDPLWQVWKRLIGDAHPLQKALFFEQVIEEHLADVREAFYDDGSLRTVEPYKEGQREGEVLLFWPNGQKKRQVSFAQGRRHGIDYCWNEAGLLVDQGAYEEGRPVGLHQRFSNAGTLIEEVKYS